MAKTQFSGPIRTGKTTGIPAQDTVGTVVLYQQVTCSTAQLRRQIQFPENCQPVDFKVIVTGSAGQVPGVNVFFGTSADQDQYAQMRCSAVGLYRANRADTSGQAMAGGFGSSSDYNVLAIEVSAQASAAALVGFEAWVGVEYIQRS
jgi:hypothetical protein